jgi:gamma-glutamyltranspeptidase/glutathione hydrolase
VSRFDRSIVASGHQLVSEAAGKILDAGGNAFDAVVAAGFASAVAEPA